jgi:hypothetical protein
VLIDSLATISTQKRRINRSHTLGLCWCGFTHRMEGECHKAKWTGEAIYRCHGKVMGTKRTKYCGKHNRKSH